MIERVELLVNLWTFGVPLLLIAGAALRLTTNVPGRVRYVIAVAAFVAMLAAPLLAPTVVGMVTPIASSGSGAPLDAVVLPAAFISLVTWGWVSVAAVLLLRDVVGHMRLRRATASPSALPSRPATCLRSSATVRRPRAVTSYFGSSETPSPLGSTRSMRPAT